MQEIRAHNGRTIPAYLVTSVHGRQSRRLAPRSNLPGAWAYLIVGGVLFVFVTFIARVVMP